MERVGRTDGPHSGVACRANRRKRYSNYTGRLRKVLMCGEPCRASRLGGRGRGGAVAGPAAQRPPRWPMTRVWEIDRLYHFLFRQGSRRHRNSVRAGRAPRTPSGPHYMDGRQARSGKKIPTMLVFFLAPFPSVLKAFRHFFLVKGGRRSGQFPQRGNMGQIERLGVNNTSVTRLVDRGRE